MKAQTQHKLLSEVAGLLCSAIITPSVRLLVHSVLPGAALREAAFISSLNTAHAYTSCHQKHPYKEPTHLFIIQITAFISKLTHRTVQLAELGGTYLRLRSLPPANTPPWPNNSTRCLAAHHEQAVLLMALQMLEWDLALDLNRLLLQVVVRHHSRI